MGEQLSLGEGNDGDVREKGKTEWPIWPALSLEHVAADEAKVKGKKGEVTARTFFSVRWPSRSPVHLYLYGAEYLKGNKQGT